MPDQNNNNNNFGNTLLGMLPGVTGAVVGGMYDQWGVEQQYQQEQELLDIQFQNQQELNQQGHDLQMQMWEKTNYPAQLAMMKEAGLNPALMYKQGGPGGITGNQTGGSAQGGQAPWAARQQMSNILMGLEAKMMEESIEGQGLKNENQQIHNDILRGTDDAGRGALELEGMSLDNIAKELDNTKKEVEIRAAEMNIKLQAVQIDKIELESAKLAKEIQLNYTEYSGTNMWANIERFVTGQYDTETYIGAASAALTVLPFKHFGTISKMFGKGNGKKIAKAGKNMYEKFINKAKKLAPKKENVIEGIKRPSPHKPKI